MFQGFWKQSDQRNRQQRSAAGSGSAVSINSCYCLHHIITIVIKLVAACELKRIQGVP